MNSNFNYLLLEFCVCFLVSLSANSNWLWQVIWHKNYINTDCLRCDFFKLLSHNLLTNGFGIFNFVRKTHFSVKIEKQHHFGGDFPGVSHGTKKYFRQFNLGVENRHRGVIVSQFSPKKRVFLTKLKITEPIGQRVVQQKFEKDTSYMYKIFGLSSWLLWDGTFFLETLFEGIKLNSNIGRLLHFSI